LSVVVTYENQNYIGTNPVGNTLGEVLPAARHDNINSQGGTLAYTPIAPLVFTFSLGHEKRETNATVFGYNDVKATAGFIWKFIHYGDRP
jgi:hypothetical protein